VWVPTFGLIRSEVIPVLWGSLSAPSDAKRLPESSQTAWSSSIEKNLKRRHHHPCL